jgi:glycosyltransferase involved in cell wall biosynthesis
MNMKQKILWWGRGDKNYSRNRIVLELMAELGCEVDFFWPAISRLGSLQAGFLSLAKPNLIWVPCFRQLDVQSASVFATKWDIPLIFDPLISAYQKEVYERKKWSENSLNAKRRKKWETKIFSLPDRIICDTIAHADYFSQQLLVPKEKLALLFVGAEEDNFLISDREKSYEKAPLVFHVLFYGSYLELHGADTIVKAAKLSENLPILWTLVGEGPCFAETKKLANGLKNINFKTWLTYEQLTWEIAQADIILGVFGDTLKADMVIPNKVHQAMAAAKPLITCTAKAYQGNIAGNPVIGWVPKADSLALHHKIRKWITNYKDLKNRGKQTRELYEQYFSKVKLVEMLREILTNC